MSAVAVSRAWVNRVELLHEEAAALGVADPVALRLEQALADLHEPEPERRPLRLALLGGTGVGKSRLFSALIRRPGASPHSDAERCFTKQPIVAAAHADRPFVAIPPGSEPRFVDGGAAGLVLCDTPDIDGAVRDNHEVTRALVDASDLIVYVTDPDKRANSDTVARVCEWAERKRWLFALNKMDRYDDRREAVAADWVGGLRELGFDTWEGDRFLVSAAEPERFDLPRLREVLLADHAGDRASWRRERFLGQALYALRPECLGPLRRVTHALAEEESRINRELRRAYREGLTSAETGGALRLVLKESAWRQLGRRCGSLMALPIWLRCRLAYVWAGFHVSRLLAGGGGALGAGAAAVAGLSAAARASLPLRQVVAGLGEGYRRRVGELRLECERLLEDHGLSELSPTAERPAPRGERPDEAEPGWLANEIDGLMRRFGTPPEEAELVAQLGSDVERAAGHTAGRITGGLRGWLFVTVCGAPPLAMLGWAGYRLGMAWWERTYLPWGFYGMALALWVLSFLPGFWALGVALRWRLGGMSPADVIGDIDEPRVTAPLRRARARVDDFARRAEELGRRFRRYRAEAEVSSDLPGRSWGGA